MPEYDDTNKGALWNNDRKTTDKHPDFNGSLNIEGMEFWIAGWRVASQNPKAPVVRIEVKRKDAVAPADYPKDPEPPKGDSLPF